MAMTGPSVGSAEVDLPDDEESAAGIFTEINITPLVDVFLVLLIIFMVTSSVMSQLSVNVQLPKMSQEGLQATPDKPESVVLTLKSDGAVMINGEGVDESRFDATMRAALEASRTKTVILEGDQSARLGLAMDWIDRAKKAGAQGFAIATAPR